VSCLALTFFYDYLESNGTPRSTLHAGLPYPPAHLDDQLGWIDYATFLEIERRVAALYPDTPELFFRIGQTFAATRGLGFTRVVVRGVFSPYQVYARFPTLVNRFLFPFVNISVTRSSPSSIRAHYVFSRAYAPSEPFLETVRGILSGVPPMMGAPPAQVRRTRHSAHEFTFDIEIAQWTGVSERVRGWWNGAAAIARMRWRNLTDAANELEDANQRLQEKIGALTEAKAELDGRVRDLTVLNALAHACAGELDTRQLLRNAATVISSGLGDVPTVLLATDGKPPALLVAASSRVTTAQLRDLRRLARSDSAEAVRIGAGFGHLDLAGRTWVSMPMQSHARLLGALLVGLPAGDPTERALFESMASQLAVSVENASSYRLVTELRDHLEIRVRERTAELEEARTKLEDTVVRLKQADEAKATFFTQVSHELRTPLQLIRGPLEDMDTQLAVGRVDDLGANLVQARRHATSLGDLVDQILDFAAIDAGRLTIKPVDMDLGALVDDVVSTFRPIAARRRITLAAELGPEAVPVLADPVLLRRVLVNLVGNALKYVDAGDRVAARVYLAGDEARLEVEDDGPGIPADEQARVFERFTRAAQHANGPIEGSGIGLAMARDLVQLHRGSIELESTPGHGCLFRVRLPRSDAQLATPRPPDASTVPVVTESVDLDEDVPTLLFPDAPEPPARPRAQVLLVEDNPEMRDFLVRILRREHHVRAVDDGREALAILQRELPDVIVSDVMMAHVGGLELCRRLKASMNTRNIPVILVSARHGSEAALEGFAAGADDYVTKPFSPPELLARVSAQIRIRTLATALMRMEKQYSLGVLSAGVAHEMLNPLNAVINAVPPLRRAVDRLAAAETLPREAERATALLDAVEASGKRMSHVVKSILAYTRQEASPRPQATRISDDIEAVLGILRYRLHDVIVHRAYAWDEPVLHYPEWLDQVIMNLLVNALDAMRERDGQLWLGTERLDDTVCIRIRDAGPGVPLELRERIFTPFFTTKPPGQGTGLGLAISREIVALHHGTLELNTTIQSGAEFIVTLPLERPPLAMEA
jgi:signal transduction histidine kinase